MDKFSHHPSSHNKRTKTKTVLLYCAGASLILSVALSTCSFIGHLDFNFLIVNNASRLIVSFWYGAMIMLLVAILLSWLAPRSTHFRFQLEPALILIILCSIALLPRLIQLDHLGIFLDERYWIEDAQGFLKGTVISPFGFIGDQPSNMPSLIVALVLQVSGNIYYAARLPGIFYSLGCIMFLFFYAKKSFGMLVAFLATLLVATSIWDIHMSRWGWNNVTPGPFIIMGIIYCYSEFLYRPRIHMALLCGFFLGIAVNLLYVSMLMVIPILGTIPLLMIGRGLFISEPKRIQYSRMTLLRMLGIVALALFITMSPTIAKVRKYPSQSIQRHKSFVAENLKVSENSASGLLFYGEQFVLAVRDFTPDLSKERITGLWGLTISYTTYFTMIIGFLYILIKKMNRQGIFVILSFLVMFVPVVILNRTTSVWREYAFLPTVHTLSAYGIYVLYRSLQKIQKIGTPIFFLCLICCIMIEFFRDYTIFAQNDLSARPPYIETLCKETSEYVVRSISPMRHVIFPDQLCSDLSITAIGDRHPNIGTYSASVSFLPDEAVIYYTIDSQKSSSFIEEYVMDSIAFEKGFQKILIAEVGRERAYVYTK